MNRYIHSKTLIPYLTIIVAILFPLTLTNCGGGGSSGGGATTEASGYSDGISLVSISFPEYTDLTGGSTTPPIDAPLTQQVVLTFSGNVQGDITTSAIQITANPGEDYQGPDILFDQTKNRLISRGTFEVLNNLVVFTPLFPTGEIDLTTNAQEENVPGLMPGYTYDVFVPVGGEGSVANLKSVAPSVNNPTSFTTVIGTSLSYLFRNQPALPPQATHVDPADGETGFPINTFSQLDGFPSRRDIRITFDQPVDFRFDNLEGVDHDGDGVREQNLFLRYTEANFYAAVDRNLTQLGYLARLNRITDSFEAIGHTRFEGLNVGLKSLIRTPSGTLLGCSGSALYDVSTQASGGICELSQERILTSGNDVTGLVLASANELYAIDGSTNTLVSIAIDSGELTIKGALPTGLGRLIDLTLGLDGELYGLRVYAPGTNDALASVEKFDIDNLIAVPVVTGIQGDFTTLAFTRSNNILLYESASRRLAQIDLALVGGAIYGEPLDSNSLEAGRKLDFDLMQYELGVYPTLVENSYTGSEVVLKPSGILPIGAWIDIMVRNDFKNISGGSMAKNLGLNPFNARSLATFRTFEPGPGEIKDVYLEEFLNNEGETTDKNIITAKALWNIKDSDETPPHYSNLLAAVGLTGGGELGNFTPIGNSDTILLDTNYQAMPLYDGSTPDIIKPTVITDGVFHFKDIIIPDGVTILAQGSNPLVFTATGRVEIGGTINISGGRAPADTIFNSGFLPSFGGSNGPGGGRGGVGQPIIPPDFTNLTELQSPPRGEKGWGKGNESQNGGQGGESNGRGVTTPWKGSTPVPDCRGAGGGGGSYLALGSKGYAGWGDWGITLEGEYFIRPPGYFWDGTYAYDASWNPGDPMTRQNEHKPDDPDDGLEHHMNQAGLGGEPGEAVFIDKDEENNYIGLQGEIQTLIGGQGGGGGGSRMDSQNPESANQAAKRNPPQSPSAFDCRGGGGGGGGGAVAIHCLGDIHILPTGRILATGGKGGGGEVIGMCQLGGGGGGGSGGAIILNSSTNIYLDYEIGADGAYATLDVSGGWGADARTDQTVTYKEINQTCQINAASGERKFNNSNAKFCAWSRGDGGWGGYGLIQLMVPDPSSNIHMKGWPDGQLKSIEADLCEVLGLPNEEKQTYDPPSDIFDELSFSFFNLLVTGTSPNFKKELPTTMDCLVAPEKTISDISARTHAVSRWIDMGRVMDRPTIDGKVAPVFYEDGLNGFRGIRLGTGGWAEVDTQNGYVVNAHHPESHPDSNDIKVVAPDLYKNDFIPDTNNVEIQFQGADAKVAGSKVPDDSSATAWTTDLASLQGKQFIRFQVRLDVAKDSQPTPNSFKPQVNYVRIRLQY